MIVNSLEQEWWTLPCGSEPACCPPLCGLWARIVLRGCLKKRRKITGRKHIATKTIHRSQHCKYLRSGPLHTQSLHLKTDHFQTRSGGIEHTCFEWQLLFFKDLGNTLWSAQIVLKVLLYPIYPFYVFKTAFLMFTFSLFWFSQRSQQNACVTAWSIKQIWEVKGSVSEAWSSFPTLRGRNKYLTVWSTQKRDAVIAILLFNEQPNHAHTHEMVYQNHTWPRITTSQRNIQGH